MLLKPRLLQLMFHFSSVIFFCVESNMDKRNFMLSAYDNGLVNSEYVFYILDVFGQYYGTY